MSSSSCSRRPPCSDTPAALPALYAAVTASHMSPASFVSTCSAQGYTGGSVELLQRLHM